MTSSIDVIGLTSEVLVWQALVLTFISFAVGLLGGFVGLALGTMRLPSLLLIGVAAPTAGGTNILVSSLSPNPPKDTDGRREENGRGVRELQGK